MEVALRQRGPGAVLQVSGMKPLTYKTTSGPRLLRGGSPIDRARTYTYPPLVVTGPAQNHRPSKNNHRPGLSRDAPGETGAKKTTTYQDLYQETKI